MSYQFIVTYENRFNSFDFSDLKYWSQIWAEILNFQL